MYLGMAAQPADGWVDRPTDRPIRDLEKNVPQKVPKWDGNVA